MGVTLGLRILGLSWGNQGSTGVMGGIMENSMETIIGSTPSPRL